MAYRTRSSRRTSRAAPRRSSARSRTGYRGRAVRTTRRRSSSGGRAGGTIRLEIVTTPAGGVARPEIGMKAAPPKRRAAF